MLGMAIASRILPAMDKRRPLLTIPEAATRLNVRPRTVRDYISKGLLPMVKLGAVRIREEDLEAFIERCRVGQKG